ncbi:hypothetical protein [Ruegeria sp. MALMAid1280]|uniref:hypothetical protein n=1 Tax=Ruegeria sp. MALMAid1280 TaxID=3411634 RepID=UPI003BA2EB32
MNFGNAGIFLRALLAPVVTSFLAGTASAQDLCATGQIVINQSEDGSTVSFPEFYPIKLTSSKDCSFKDTCLYDLLVVSGDKTKTQLKELEITDLCSAASEYKGQFEKHGVSEYSPFLMKVYEYSRFTSIAIETTMGSIGISKTDYLMNSDGFGWVHNLLEDGGTFLTAGPAASTFDVSYTFNP